MDWVKSKQDRALPEREPLNTMIEGNGKHSEQPIDALSKRNSDAETKKLDKKVDKKNKEHIKSAMASKPESKTHAVSSWLEGIAKDNFPSLQNLPPPARKKKDRKRQSICGNLFASSILWGTSTTETTIDEAPDVLDSLLNIWVDNIDRESSAQFAQDALRLGPSLESSASESDSTSQEFDPVATAKTLESVAKWISKCLPVHGDDPYVALVSVAWIHGLRTLGKQLPASIWLETLQNILTQVDRAWSDSSPEDCYPWLIWSCEVPLVLATQLSQLGHKDRMVIETQERLYVALTSAAENPSSWIRGGGERLRALIACVLRCQWTLQALGGRGLYASHRKHFAKLCEIAVRLTDNRGVALLHDYDVEAEPAAFWEAIKSLTGNSKKVQRLIEITQLDRSSTQVPLGNPKKPAKRTDSKAKKQRLKLSGLPKLGYYCDKAEMATMRRGWERGDCRVAVDYARDPMWIDIIGSSGDRLITGPWELTVQRDGVVVETDVGWSEVCWYSDDDVDYLETECEIEGVAKIQRQSMLIRDESMVFLCDTLLANDSATWNLQSSLSIHPDYEFKASGPHHEGELFAREANKHDNARHALVLPIGLPEWKRSPSNGKLKSEAGLLTLQQQVIGRRLMCPMLLSLKRPVRNQQHTWRHLTVAEDLQIQNREVAQAFRVQVGKDQVVFYRSLAKNVRRSAMGMHVNTEFYAARFDSDGEFEPLVEIESEA